MIIIIKERIVHSVTNMYNTCNDVHMKTLQQLPVQFPNNFAIALAYFFFAISGLKERIHLSINAKIIS